ncbi:putative thiopurine S-methyltransferase isoform X2 [Glandiceps talaboti]
MEELVSIGMLSISSLLVQQIDTMTSGRKGLKIFVPLCGKSIDLIWLAQQGHDVTGVEYSDIACEAFFKENNIEYSAAPAENLKDGKLYTSKDNKIKIYQCDFFQFSSDVAGQFDAAWDRGAFGAITAEDRKKYSDVLISVMKPDSVCLMTTLQYDTTVMKGPPRHVPLEVIQEYYGERFDIKPVCEHDILDEENWKERGHKYFMETVFSISPKK